MRMFVWHEDDSLLHRLNPLSKLALNVAVALLVITMFEPTVPFLIGLLALLATRLVGRVPWPALLRPLAFASIAAFGTFVPGALFYAGPGSEPGASAVSLGPWSVPTAALVYGATLTARLFAVFATSMLFVLTTEPTSFVLALIQQLHVSPRIGYSVFTAYRFAPMLQDELDNIRAAYQMRGGTGTGPLARAREMLGYAIPLLATAVRKGEQVSLAMESRAFGALSERTYYRVTALTRADALFIAASFSVLAALLVFQAVMAGSH